MWSNRDSYGLRTQSLNPLHGYAQLRGWTTPKKIRRCSGNNQKMRLKRADARSSFFQREIVSLSIDEQQLASGSGNLIIRKQQFQRNMRLFAAKVCRAFEVPVGIDQRKLHPALPENSLAMANAAADVPKRLAMLSRFSSQNSRSSSRVCSMPICGCQPV